MHTLANTPVTPVETLVWFLLLLLLAGLFVSFERKY